jgi:hypothetical protein
MSLAAAVTLSLALSAGAAAQSKVQIRMERSACFGTCPVYTLTVDGDGTVSYDGREHVRVHGSQTWRIAPDAVGALAREMEQAGFFKMKDSYTALVTDMPTTFITLTIDGRSKRIQDYFGAPAALTQLEMRVDAVSGARGRIFLDAAGFREMLKGGWKADADKVADLMTRAARWGDAELVKALLAAGADPRARDASGVTPVMHAAESGDPGTVRALLAAGGDPTARDGAGRNAADRARDALANGGARPFVEATGAATDYALVLKLLTDE